MSGAVTSTAYAETPRLTIVFPPADVKDPTELAQGTGSTLQLGCLSVTVENRLDARMGALADWLYGLLDPEP